MTDCGSINFANYWTRLVRAIGLAVLLALVSSHTIAAPKAKLWELWTQHDPGSTLVVDHSAWNDLLKRFVLKQKNKVNRFDYARFSETDQAQLKRYLSTLAAIPISNYNRKQQRAYWINLYNALTVNVILAHYPVNTIMDISPSWFSHGPWREKWITVENQALTLDDIEHRILRPIWKDPRVHYAVNCAAIGCPNLQSLAFTAENTELMLEQAAREFVNHPRGASVSFGQLRVSSIYHWFEEDFGGNDAGVIEHLKLYADAKLLAALNEQKRISDHFYDWTINNPNSPEPAMGIFARRGS